ncbi:MAG: hypothetical protein AAB580_01775 [Patescibacteria group bacterium]
MPASFSQNIKDIFGTTTRPPGVDQYTPVSSTTEVEGLTLLLANIIKISIFVAGIWSLFNFLFAGILYIGSSGNPETIKQASAKIWMSMLGLLIVAASLIISAIIGLIFFKDATAILQPIIPRP